MGRTRHGKIMFVLMVICLAFIDEIKGGKTHTNSQIRRHLKGLNKPALRSIKLWWSKLRREHDRCGDARWIAWIKQKRDLTLANSSRPHRNYLRSEDGDIIDCVDIYNQPAFDHPLLKNHTIQMRPSNFNSEKISPLKPLEQLWHQSGSCGEGTVPIRRTGKADLLRAGSLTYGMKADSYQKESARMRLTGINHGAAAYIGVWNIYVAPDETSISSIFVARQGKKDLLNSGWIVSSKIYGDNLTRLYGFWGSESGGCFDMMCPGFVQTNSQIALGGVLTPLSVYNGPQRFIHVKIHKDLKNDHWWLDINFITIGYWPSTLLYNMVYDADLLLWGGQVHNTFPGGRHTTTQMGSGHFSSEGANKSSIIAGMVFLDKFNYELPPPDLYKMEATKPGCYDISKETGYVKGLGQYFYYGGPGGPDCEK